MNINDKLKNYECYVAEPLKPHYALSLQYFKNSVQRILDSVSPRKFEIRWRDDTLIFTKNKVEWHMHVTVYSSHGVLYCDAVYCFNDQMHQQRFNVGDCNGTTLIHTGPIETYLVPLVYYLN